MPEFNDKRIQLQSTRRQIADTESELLLAKEALKRVNAADGELNRVFDAHNENHRARRNELAEAKARLEQKIKRLKTVKEELKIAVDTRFEAFLFADPQTQLEQLSDDYPFLLLPVRLETRFKTTKLDSGAVANQLWVRIFPDDCMVDSFEAELSESEIKSAREYWAGVWKSGGVKAQEQAAWRSLVASYGAGRAAWIVKDETASPVNAADKPVKDKDTDVVLAIISEDNPAEQAAIATYWKAAWLADGDQAKTQAAFDALAGSPGMDTEQAAALIKKYVPFNFLDRPSPPLKKSEVGLTVVFVVFRKIEELDAKQTSWTRAPKVNVLPDRFVLILDDGVEVKEYVGRAIPSPLTVGIDPSADEAEQLKQEDGELGVGEEMRWMVDFERAVEIGMGFKINLNAQQAQNGFRRITVLGLRLSTDESEGQALLEELFHHHKFGKNGFQLLPQGIPTNNVEGKSSGHSTSADGDADAAYEVYFGEKGTYSATADWKFKQDGQWLAEWLGLSPDFFQHTFHADGKDQSHAAAMNTALWPATMGYLMDTMMQQVFDADPNNRRFDDDAVLFTRWFFTNFVSGRGPVPAIRIGRQPYGILPATAFSSMEGLKTGHIKPPAGITLPENWHAGISELYRILQIMQVHWQWFSSRADFVGKKGPSIDPQQVLLNVLGLHPSSVEYYQRYTLGLSLLWNVLNFNGAAPTWQALMDARKKIKQSGEDEVAEGLDSDAMFLLHWLGYKGGAEPDILDQTFMADQFLLKGPVVDDRPLSETDPVRAYAIPAADGDPERNYIEWLIDAARSSHETLRKEEGFIENKSPVALLYLMLRHALMEGYADAGLRLYFEKGLLQPAQYQAAKLEPSFIHVQDNKQSSESRWSYLYRTAPEITDSNQTLVVDYVTAQIRVEAFFSRFVTEQIGALEHLKNASTAQLERAFAEHIDSVSYRLDAWIEGMLKFHLSTMRFKQGEEGVAVKQGLYLGAYGWLEEVKPEFKELKTKSLRGELSEIFNKKGEPPLVTDNTNCGYIHAPSLNHAVTAAVLRNAHLAYESEQNGQSFAINLSSERVRKAMSFLEGIRNGQSLAALLGYELERGLHDRYNESQQLFLDGFIFELRKAFPLVANRMSTTKDDDAAIEAIEARNVVNGLKLIEQVKSSGIFVYPFGKAGLPPAENQQQADAINAEVERMMDIHDAIADLALAEGVHQVGLGNYDRAAATLDAFGKATFPVEPEVAQTPRSGVTLTHRIGIHLETGLDATANPYPALAMTPRAKAEPALNKWLSEVLPAPDKVGVWVTYFDSLTKSNESVFVTQANLGLQAIDMLFLLNTESEQAMAELDDRLEHYIRTSFPARPEGEVRISYTKPGEAGKATFFELTPLLHSLRALVLSSRPLRPGDIALHEEATAEADNQVFYEDAKVTAIENLRNDLDGLRNLLAAALVYVDARADYADAALLKEQIANPAPGDDLDVLNDNLSAIHQDIIDQLDLLATNAAADLHKIAWFGFLQAGIGHVHDEKRRLLNLMTGKITEIVKRWAEKSAEFTTLLNEYDTLPPATPDTERYDLLAKLERTISTSYLLPGAGDTPATIRSAILDKKQTGPASFDAKLADLNGYLSNLPGTLADALADIETLVEPAVPPKLPLTAYDLVPVDLEDIRRQLLAFGEDILAQTGTLITVLQKQVDSVAALIVEYNAGADPNLRVKAMEQCAKQLLGDGFHLLPSFSLAGNQADELSNAFSASESLWKFQAEELPAEERYDFPVDFWLYGVARVREKMAHWENMTFLVEAFGQDAPEFQPLQLPYRIDDRWLALRFRKTGEAEADFKVDADRLLYTAAYAKAFDKTAPQCGFLVDEWTEVIPTSRETTGIAFHFDRPNAEPPQVMLLAMPSVQRGRWQWADLVKTLSETYDLAKLRAVEPGFVDDTPYARFLPATMMAVTTQMLTISTNLALNNAVYAYMDVATQLQLNNDNG